MRVLLIEDDLAIAASIVDGLADAGITATHAETGSAGMALAQSEPVECVLLDLGLPDIDGVDVCRALHEETTLPVIILSARGTEADRVQALELGADDYLVKPFGMRELIARIRAVRRRHEQNPATEPTSLTVGALTLDARTQQATLAGEPVHLTPTEFAILTHLCRDPGAVCRRSDIVRDVWNTDWVGGSKSLDAHIASVRKKLGHRVAIQSVHGVGFRIEAGA